MARDPSALALFERELSRLTEMMTLTAAVAFSLVVLLMMACRSCQRRSNRDPLATGEFGRTSHTRSCHKSRCEASTWAGVRHPRP